MLRIGELRRETNGLHYYHSIHLSELPFLDNPLEELASNCKLERKVILGPRFEPFVKLYLDTALIFNRDFYTQKRTYNVWMIEALQHLHLFPHARFFSLDLLLGNNLQRDILGNSLRLLMVLPARRRSRR